MVEEMVPGERYWCIRPSSESEGYGEDNPRAPWRGILVQSRTGAYCLHRMGPDDSVSCDSNSFSYVQPQDLFLTQQEALKAYIIRCQVRARALLKQSADLMRSAEDAERELDAIGEA